jgi:hypothetical protein
MEGHFCDPMAFAARGGSSDGFPSLELSLLYVCFVIDGHFWNGWAEIVYT